jgi:hypothetical protein
MRMLAYGILAAAGVALAAPAFAQGVYVGGHGGGVGVGVDVDSGYRHRDRDWDGDRSYRRSYRAYGYEPNYQRCSTTIIRENGMVRKIRRCRD